MTYKQIIAYLESLNIMPKTMPGLDKISAAVKDTDWFLKINPDQVITVAGTNGKGTTCAVLQKLLMSTGKNVGLYTSPHLISTTERIRYNSINIPESIFVKLFLKNKLIIKKHDLTHFESLTLLAGDYFFSGEFIEPVDYAIFEVGLGGTYDATAIFPNKYAVVTKLGLDHQSILGNSLLEIAKNKLGIIKSFSTLIHQPWPEEIIHAINTDVESHVAPKLAYIDLHQAETHWGIVQTNLFGYRSLENINLALTVFEIMGYKPENYLTVLKEIYWPGRMQLFTDVTKVFPDINSHMYLSGDHNIQGVESLVDILKQIKYKNVHLIIGIGKDKNYTEMLQILMNLSDSKIYLTETPFKGLPLDEYPIDLQKSAILKNKDVNEILKTLNTNSDDIVVVTGSLYLVGLVLSNIETGLKT